MRGQDGREARRVAARQVDEVADHAGVELAPGGAEQARVGHVADERVLEDELLVRVDPRGHQQLGVGEDVKGFHRNGPADQALEQHLVDLAPYHRRHLQDASGGDR